MAVYKVDYSWYQEFPCGGPGIWKKAIKLYDAETAEDLNKQIAEFFELHGVRIPQAYYR